MATFSNASEYEVFHNEYCRHCLNHREREYCGDQQGCPIADMPFLEGTALETTEGGAIFNQFLYRGDDEYLHCSMFLPAERGD